MTTASPTGLSAAPTGGIDEHRAAAERRGGPDPAASPDHLDSGHSAAADEPKGITDQILGRALVVGTVAGVPLTWAVATALMLPWGFAIAASAAVFVGIASGPFFGAAAVLMATVLRQERQERESAAWR